MPDVRVGFIGSKSWRSLSFSFCIIVVDDDDDEEKAATGEARRNCETETSPSIDNDFRENSRRGGSTWRSGESYTPLDRVPAGGDAAKSHAASYSEGNVRD